MQVTFNRYTAVRHVVTGFRILLLCAAVSASSLSGMAADQTGSRRQHCGSYCVYTALKLFGRGPPQFEQFEKVPAARCHSSKVPQQQGARHLSAP